ncbi:MAG TPA: hypothetical protein VFF08_10840, partial [Trueperaceae bacterium]|nr:hypothetical protein [Trueperaceae bacterium]
IFRAVSELGKSKTIVMIAHRMSTVRGCDVIYVLDHGNVEAQGTYDELLVKSPVFRAMVSAGAPAEPERERAAAS